MEEADADLALGSHRRELFLGVEQGPAGGGDAAVLVAVRVADHHHLRLVAGIEVAAVGGELEQRLENRRPGLQVVDRLEQRCDVEGHPALLVHEACGTGQQQHR